MADSKKLKCEGVAPKRKPKPKITAEKPYSLTTDGVTAHFGFPRTTTYELLRTRKIKGFKMGRRTMILTDSVEDYLKTMPAYKSSKEAA